MSYRRISIAALALPVSDTQDRYVMPMSTFIASEEWMAEVDWDGSVIGDMQIFRNKHFRNGVRAQSEGAKPIADEWEFWNGVPRSQIKSYRFEDVSDIRPMTIGDGERKAQSRQATSGRQAAAGAAHT